MGIESIIQKVKGQDRLGPDEGLALLREADLLTLGELASTVRKRLHAERQVTFIVDRNINYTNICVNKCKFCAFYREADSPEAYVLAKDDIFRKIEETLALGGTQILMQGGVHPDLGIEYMQENLSYRHTEDGEVHPGEVVEEKISLSERFGLWVSFYPFSQDEYLAIVAQWLRQFGVSGDAIAAARQDSLVWALERGSRSGRVAYQFACDYSGRHAQGHA
jgi:hypothetical protein